MRNEAVRVFGNFFCLYSNFKPIFYCQFAALGFMRSYSQTKFVEESEISCNPMIQLKLEIAIARCPFPKQEER